MCGIAGYYNADVTENVSLTVQRALGHRGPDGRGLSRSGRNGLIHTRLSVIELTDLGNQPYHFQNLSLTFNGEIYNYREVREELKVKGYSFDSNSDTEVVIKAFHCWRESSVHRFIGMFAFSIYDSTSGELFLFRDRLGVKPVYYFQNASGFYFASELKALLWFGPDRQIDINALSLYFRFGYVPGHLSIYAGVQKLPSGTWLKVSGQKIELHKYWNVDYTPEYGRDDSQWLEELNAILSSSFRYRMVADVPVGLFLSGGVDSSLVAAILSKSHPQIQAFNVGFAEQRFDESKYAKSVAEHLGISLCQSTLSLHKAKEIFGNFYDIYDEPFADTSGIPTSFVARLAKENNVKVVLSADGADEMFGGYSHYVHIHRLFAKIESLPAGVRRALCRSTSIMRSLDFVKRTPLFNMRHRLSAMGELAHAGSHMEFYQSCIANQTWDEIDDMLSQSNFKGQYLAGSSSTKENMRAAMLSWDLKYFLPDDLLVKVDRATMYHGIEAREPFLDHRIVELAGRIPVEKHFSDGRGKYFLRKILSRHLPAEFFERTKQGFSVPIFEWFRKDLDSLFSHYFSTESLRNVPELKTEVILLEYKKYRYNKVRGRQHNIEKMWRILSYLLWKEKYSRT